MQPLDAVVIFTAAGLGAGIGMGLGAPEGPLEPLTGTIPVGTVPIEIAPLGTIPIGTVPIGTAPVGTTPVGTKPSETAPIGTKISLETFPDLLVNVIVKSNIIISLNTAKLLRTVDILCSFISFLYDIYNIYEAQLGNIIQYRPNEKLTQGLKYINNLLNPNKEKVVKNENLLKNGKMNGMYTNIFVCIYT
jgi:hypothetical protein